MALPLLPLVVERDTGALCDLLDWSVLLADDPVVLGTKTGRLQTTLRYVCPDTEHHHPTERASYLARLHTVLGTLTEGWAADWDWWHEPAPAYPAGVWTTPVDWLVDEVRRHDYAADARYESQAYLTLSWLPPRGKRRWLQDLFVTTRVRQFDRALAQDLQAFQHGVTRFVGLLRDLLVAVEPLDADETCTYLHQAISWDRYPLRCPTPATQLDQQLSNTVFTPGQPPQLGDQLVQPLYIASWQAHLGTWLPEALEKLPCPVRLHVRWVPFSTQAAAHFLRWEEKRWATGYRRGTKLLKMGSGVDGQEDVAGRDERPDAIAAGQSILDVQAQVLMGEEVLGMLTPTLLTWAPDPETLAAQTQALETVCFAQGLVMDAERAGASLAWLASLPGHVSLGTRGRALRTQELTALMPHSTVWAGPARDAHLDGPPVLVASTDGTPFRLVTHVGELGHVMIAGPSRSGKSGLLGLLARQWFRYPGARLCLFDRDLALKAATLLGGGLHYALGASGSVGFQPLGRLETDDEQRWALTWLDGVLTGEDLAPMPHEREELWTTVQRLAGLPVAQRTLSMCQRLLQVQRLKVGLTPFCQGGPYGFFDATADSLTLETRLVCFEVGTLLSLPRAIGPTLGYLFHRLETDWFTGDPVAIGVDEARWLLATEGFLGELEIWLKARAKKNVSVWLSTQELFDIQRTTAWQAVLASVPTWILLPNAAATRPEVAPFYEGIGCSEAERQLLATAQPLRDYLYRSPLGTRLFQLRLSPVERLLCAASRVEELAVLVELAPQVPPERLPAAWLRHWGQEEAAALLEALPGTAERAVA